MQLKQNEITMNQFTEQQLQGIISPDKERLIYEIGAKGEWSQRPHISYWPSYEWMANVYKKFTEYHNSKGKIIAKFKLKSWKS
jgi:hypothetical protein